MSYYAAFFDITLHYAGPFDSVEACNAHAALEEAMTSLSKHVPLDSIDAITFQRVS